MRLLRIGDFFPAETRRAFGMVTKSKTFAERIVGNALWHDVTDALLTSTLHWNWVSLNAPPSYFHSFPGGGRC